MQWLRWYHGTAADKKFGRIARATGQTRERVVFVWAMILESASEGDPRGEFDVQHDDIADVLNCPADDINAIMAAMCDAGLIDVEGDCCVVCAWQKRQPSRDDSTKRQREKRARDAGAGDGHADVTRKARDSDAEVTPPDTELDSDTEDTPSLRSGDAGASPPSDEPSEDSGQLPAEPEPEPPPETPSPDIPLTLRRAVPSEPAALKALLFGQCLAWLVENTGKSEPSCRSVIGKWCRDHGEGNALEAFMAASRECPVDPVSWFEHRLRDKRPKYAQTETLGPNLAAALEEFDESDREALPRA